MITTNTVKNLIVKKTADERNYILTLVFESPCFLLSAIWLRMED